MFIQILGVFDILKKKEMSLQYYLQRLYEIQEEELDVLISIGAYYLQEDNFEDSLNYFEKALRMAIDMDDEEMEAFIIDSIGDVYLNTRNIDKALEYYKEAMRIYFSIKSPLKDEIKEKIKEVKKIKEAIDITEISQIKERKVPEPEEPPELNLEKLNSKLDFVVNMVDSTSIYSSYSNDKEAVSHLKDAFRISRDIGDEAGEAALLLMLGNIALKQKEYTDAKKYLEDSKTFFRRLGDEKGTGVTMVLLGTLNFALGDMQEVSDNFRNAVEKFQKIGNKDAESAAIDLLNTLYED